MQFILILCGGSFIAFSMLWTIIQSISGWPSRPTPIIIAIGSLIGTLFALGRIVYFMFNNGRL